MTLRKVRRKSEFSTHMVNYWCSHREFSWNPNSQYTRTWSVAAWPPRRLCYRPAVFFCHIRLTALSFPHGKKFGARFKKLFFFYFFKNCVSQVVSVTCSHRHHDLKPHNTNLISLLQANPHQLEELMHVSVFFLTFLVTDEQKKTFEN